MKKIATITFHRAINFGAVLQTYALQHFITECGADCEVLDYRCKYLENHYKPFSIEKIKNIKWLIKCIIKNQYICDNRKNFKKFSDTYIKCSPTPLNREDLTDINSKYDAFICGSDQIWSPVCAGFDKSYFLDFVSDPTKKYSYAASIGAEKIPSELVNEYKKLLSNFEKISVREQKAADLIYQLTNNSAAVVVDPTLLLDRSAWEKIAEPVKINDKYVLLYLLAKVPETIDFARQLAKQHGIKVVFINTWLFDEKGMENLKKITPGQWLYLFLHAEYIVTNSFHGLAFSLNFHKNIYADLLPAQAKSNSRIEHLISLAGIKSRLLCSKEFLADSKIDYERVDRILKSEIDMSKKYLEEIVSCQK